MNNRTIVTAGWIRSISECSSDPWNITSRFHRWLDTCAGWFVRRKYWREVALHGRTKPKKGVKLYIEEKGISDLLDRVHPLHRLRPIQTNGRMNGLERKTDRGLAGGGGRLRTGDGKQESNDDGRRRGGGGRVEGRRLRNGSSDRDFNVEHTRFESIGPTSAGLGSSRHGPATSSPTSNPPPALPPSSPSLLLYPSVRDIISVSGNRAAPLQVFIDAVLPSSLTFSPSFSLTSNKNRYRSNWFHEDFSRRSYLKKYRNETDWTLGLACRTQRNCEISVLNAALDKIEFPMARNVRVVYGERRLWDT